MTLDILFDMVLEPNRNGQLDREEIKDLIYRMIWAAEEQFIGTFEPELVGMLTYWNWDRLRHLIPPEPDPTNAPESPLRD